MLNLLCLIYFESVLYWTWQKLGKNIPDTHWGFIPNLCKILHYRGLTCNRSESTLNYNHGIFCAPPSQWPLPWGFVKKIRASLFSNFRTYYSFRLSPYFIPTSCMLKRLPRLFSFLKKAVPRHKVFLKSPSSVFQSKNSYGFVFITRI